MVRVYQPNGVAMVYFIINKVTKIYEGFIPAGCYRRPYMPIDELEQE